MALPKLELFSVSEDPNPFSRVVTPLLDLDKEAGGRDPAGFGFAQAEGPVIDFQPALESHHSAVPFPESLQHAIPSLPQVIKQATVLSHLRAVPSFQSLLSSHL